MLNNELEHLAVLSAIYANLGYKDLIKLIDKDVDEKIGNDDKLKDEFKKEKDYFQNYLNLKAAK